jgi:hypothetical protein
MLNRSESTITPSLLLSSFRNRLYSSAILLRGTARGSQRTVSRVGREVGWGGGTGAACPVNRSRPCPRAKTPRKSPAHPPHPRHPHSRAPQTSSTPPLPPTLSPHALFPPPTAPPRPPRTAGQLRQLVDLLRVQRDGARRAHPNRVRRGGGGDRGGEGSGWSGGRGCGGRMQRWARRSGVPEIGGGFSRRPPSPRLPSLSSAHGAPYDCGSSRRTRAAHFPAPQEAANRCTRHTAAPPPDYPPLSLPGVQHSTYDYEGGTAACNTCRAGCGGGWANATAVQSESLRVAPPSTQAYSCLAVREAGRRRCACTAPWTSWITSVWRKNAYVISAGCL